MVTTQGNILVVEDEADIAELLRFHLARAGYAVRTTASGQEALRLIDRQPPDLVLLDLMLPDWDGLEVCRALKQDSQTARIPIVMVTAKGGESDIVAGLELGADDYITKPFSIKVVLARVQAVLRRRALAAASGAAVRIHGLVVDPARHEVLVKGQPVAMTFSELRILYFLACHPGWVLTRKQIIDGVRGEDYPVTERAVDVQIVNIRRKLGPRGKLIETVHGVGYRFKDVEE